MGALFLLFFLVELLQQTVLYFYVMSHSAGCTLGVELLYHDLEQKNRHYDNFHGLFTQECISLACVPSSAFMFEYMVT